MGQWFYHYNAFGELVEQIDAKNQATINEYDELGRMTSRIDQDANAEIVNTTIWTYVESDDEDTDGLGQISTVAEYAGEADSVNLIFGKLYEYDGYGRLIDTGVTFDDEQESYIKSVRYDDLGRAFREYHSLGGATETEFNACVVRFTKLGCNMPIAA